MGSDDGAKTGTGEKRVWTAPMLALLVAGMAPERTPVFRMLGAHRIEERQHLWIDSLKVGLLAVGSLPRARARTGCRISAP